MKLTKAIELSRDAENSLRLHKKIDHADAIKIGIEALKRVQATRERLIPETVLLLPGETPDDDPTRSLHHIKAVLESPLGREPRH